MNRNALRFTPNYDPADDMVVSQFAGEDQEELFLKVRHRLLWFHEYLRSHGLTGRVDDSELSYDPEARLILAKASVYIDGKLTGRSCAGMYYNPAFGKSDLSIGQTVATMAMGRALSHAGFGTVDAITHNVLPNPVAQNAKRSTIRACDYDPTMTGALTELDGTPFLNVRFRTYWFHQYIRQLAQMGILTGESYIDDSDVTFSPESKLLFARAKVVINGQVVGESAGSRPYDPEDPAYFNQRVAVSPDQEEEKSDLPVLMVCTSAYGRALSNAGFGVTADTVGDGEEKECDAGIRVVRTDGELSVAPLYKEKGSAAAHAEQPVEAPAADVPAEQPAEPPAPSAPTEQLLTGAPQKPKRGRKPRKPVEQPTEPPAAKQEVPTPAVPAAPGKTEEPADLPHEDKPEEPVKAPTADNFWGDLPEMPYEEAMAFIMPLGGMQGKTMAEAVKLAPQTVAFYAGPLFHNKKLVDLRRAAIAVLAHNKKKEE